MRDPFHKDPTLVPPDFGNPHIDPPAKTRKFRLKQARKQKSKNTFRALHSKAHKPLGSRNSENVGCYSLQVVAKNQASGTGCGDEVACVRGDAVHIGFRVNDGFGISCSGSTWSICTP